MGTDISSHAELVELLKLYDELKIRLKKMQMVYQ